MMKRFALTGIGAERSFDAAQLDPATRKAIEAAIGDAQKSLQATIDKTTSSAELFGTRVFLDSITSCAAWLEPRWEFTAIRRGRPNIAVTRSTHTVNHWMRPRCMSDG